MLICCGVFVKFSLVNEFCLFVEDNFRLFEEVDDWFSEMEKEFDCSVVNLNEI